MVTQVQILDETVCISHSTYGKGMNPIILRVNSRADWVRQQVQEKENSEFKHIKLHLKIDLVSQPACAVGLVNTYIYIYI